MRVQVLFSVFNTHPSADRKKPCTFPRSACPVSSLFLFFSVAPAAGPAQHPWPCLTVKAGGCCSQRRLEMQMQLPRDGAEALSQQGRLGTSPRELPAQGQGCSRTRGCRFCLSFLSLDPGKGLVLLRRAGQCFVAAMIAQPGLGSCLCRR